jgi:hypothetical protein
MILLRDYAGTSRTSTIMGWRAPSPAVREGEKEWHVRASPMDISFLFIGIEDAPQEYANHDMITRITRVSSEGT